MQKCNANAEYCFCPLRPLTMRSRGPWWGARDDAWSFWRIWRSLPRRIAKSPRVCNRLSKRKEDTPWNTVPFSVSFYLTSNNSRVIEPGTSARVCAKLGRARARLANHHSNGSNGTPTKKRARHWAGSISRPKPKQGLSLSQSQAVTIFAVFSSR